MLEAHPSTHPKLKGPTTSLEFPPLRERPFRDAATYPRIQKVPDVKAGTLGASWAFALTSNPARAERPVAEGGLIAGCLAEANAPPGASFPAPEKKKKHQTPL